MQMTKSIPNRICATLLLIFSVVGGRALFVFEEMRQVGNGQIWLHVLPGIATIFIAGLWLMFVTPVITVPCAALISMQGLWIIWFVSRGIAFDHPGTRIVLTMILFIPAAIEVRHFIRKKHSMLERLR